jgi:RNA polymerase sigma-70 factor (ECF subfamily)
VSFITNNKYQHLSDKELVLSYKNDHQPDALGALYQRYMDLVYGVCLKYLKERESSRDAVINIYEELTVKLKKHEVENFKSWLYRVAKNHCLMYLRSPKNLKTREFVPEVMQFEETVHLNGELDDEANFSKLEHCLKGLVNEQAQSVKLFYYEQKCYKEIAEITGFDQNMVRSYIQNGRRNLKICMDKNQ